VGLWKIAEPDLMRFMGLLWRLCNSEDEFISHVADVIEQPGFVTFVFIDRSDGHVLGSSSYLDIRPQHRTLEIGSTWIGHQFQGTFVNPEAKLLMLRHAFEDLGCVRVQLKSDARNVQSRAAMTKLGAKFEGILRKHMINPDGFVRDTAMFSIIAEEWPQVRQSLEERLAHCSS
jgi:N-acetyltransferase